MSGGGGEVDDQHAAAAVAAAEAVLISATATTSASSSATVDTGANTTCPAYFVFADRPTSLLFMTTALISTIACYVTIRECIRDLKQRSRKAERAIPLLILSLNVAYIVYFVPKIFGPIPGPRVLSLCAWGVFGTVQTCTAQAFMIQFGVWSVAYQLMALVWSYTAIVKYRWQERKLLFNMKWIMSCIWIGSFIMASLGLVLRVYNFKDQNCYISAFPTGCFDQDCAEQQDGQVQAASILRWIIKVPYLFIEIFMCIFFFIVFNEVRLMEEQMGRYASTAFFVTTTPPTNVSVTTNPPRPPEHRKHHHDIDRNDDVTDQEDVEAMGPAPPTPTPSPQQQQPQQDVHAVAETVGSTSVDLDRYRAHSISHPTPPSVVRSSSAYSSSPRGGGGGRGGVDVVVNRAKSRAVAIQAIVLSGYYFLVIFCVLFELFSAYIFGYKNYNLHMFKVIVDNLQGFVFFMIFARPRDKTMMTTEGIMLRKLLFCRWIPLQHFFVHAQQSAQNVIHHSSSSGNNANLSSLPALDTNMPEHAESTRRDLSMITDGADDLSENRSSSSASSSPPPPPCCATAIDALNSTNTPEI